MTTIPLIVERNNETDMLWGRIEYEDDLIIDFAPHFDELEEKMYKRLNDLYKLGRGKVTLEPYYDLTAFFKEKNFLNLSAVAERAGINRSVMAQYAAGIKHPSLQRAEEIQQVIHNLGNELRSVNLAVKTLPLLGEWNQAWGKELTAKWRYGFPDVLETAELLEIWNLRKLNLATAVSMLKASIAEKGKAAKNSNAKG